MATNGLKVQKNIQELDSRGKKGGVEPNPRLSITAPSHCMGMLSYE
jgi:hypothetical protein